MKKKILFVMSQFNMGGIEKELLCLLRSINRSQYSPELLLTGGGGQMEPELKGLVPVHYLSQYTVGDLRQLIKHCGILDMVKRSYYYLRMKLAKNCEKDHWAVKIKTVIPGRYDCVVAYDGLDMAVISTAEQVDAKVKVVWEHGPLVRVEDVFVKRSKKAARNFDKIVCVSQALKKEFSESYELPEDRFCVLYNLIDVEELLERAKEPISDMPRGKGTNIVTVGRLHPQKGSEKIPVIARMLLDAGYDIHWYLVGDGELRQQIEDLCARYNVSDRVILLGTKNNPFPYIKNCDIYVQTSSWEGWCLTVQEARILCKPMVVTPLAVLREQIVNGKNGLIADDMTPEAIFNSIRSLLDHPQKQERFILELEKEDRNGLEEIKKLYDIVESGG